MSMLRSPRCNIWPPNAYDAVRLGRFPSTLTHAPLMPAKAGIQCLAKELGPRFRGDERKQGDSSRLENTLGECGRQRRSGLAGSARALPVGLVAVAGHHE